MRSCYEILGVGEDATLEEIREAFEKKAARYKSGLYDDDPQYAKRKLKELQTAHEEAVALATGNMPEIAVLKPTVSYDENPEEYMSQLYHKHLTQNINRKAGLRPKRPKAFAKGDAAYKRSVMFFWIGIVATLLIIGSLL